MRVGLQLIFQNWNDTLSDGDMMNTELRLGEMADQLGFDRVWPVEHHFTPYAMCPDNFAALAYLAGRTEQIQLATGAAILPWNDPLRVAEKIVMLDHLSGGRAVLGMGRGLAPVEYAGLRIDQNEARERFDEAAAMILEALDTGVMENEGPMYPQPRVDIRPKPLRGFRDRAYGVANSEGSSAAVAGLGLGLMGFLTTTPEKHAIHTERHREQFVKAHGKQAPPAVVSEFLFCHPDGDYAEEMALRYMTDYYATVVNHYEFAGTHWAETKGYQSYAEAAQQIRDRGIDESGKEFVESQLFGTPDQIIEKLHRQFEALGEFELAVVTRYADLPQDQIEDSLKLFAKEVLPELQKMKSSAPSAAVN